MSLSSIGKPLARHATFTETRCGEVGVEVDLGLLAHGLEGLVDDSGDARLVAPHGARREVRRELAAHARVPRRVERAPASA